MPGRGDGGVRRLSGTERLYWCQRHLATATQGRQQAPLSSPEQPAEARRRQRLRPSDDRPATGLDWAVGARGCRGPRSERGRCRTAEVRPKPARSGARAAPAGQPAVACVPDIGAGPTRKPLALALRSARSASGVQGTCPLAGTGRARLTDAAVAAASFNATLSCGPALPSFIPASRGRPVCCSVLFARSPRSLHVVFSIRSPGQVRSGRKTRASTSTPAGSARRARPGRAAPSRSGSRSSATFPSRPPSPRPGPIARGSRPIPLRSRRRRSTSGSRGPPPGRRGSR